jgi:hypothetical protein
MALAYRGHRSQVGTRLAYAITEVNPQTRCAPPVRSRKMASPSNSPFNRSRDLNP